MAPAIAAVVAFVAVRERVAALWAATHEILAIWDTAAREAAVTEVASARRPLSTCDLAFRLVT
jgi:hypothetical protein